MRSNNGGFARGQVSWFALLGLQVTQTALWALPSAERTQASIAANAVLSIGTLFLCVLSYAEHTRSVRPSFILNAYLFCSLLFDIARARTLWLRYTDSFNETIAVVTTVAVGAKLVVLLVEAVEKRHILKSEFAGYPPEATAGFYSRAVFWWLNPVFKHGFSKFLSVEDLFTLDKELSSERLLAMFEERWSKGKLQITDGLSHLNPAKHSQCTQKPPTRCNRSVSKQPNGRFSQQCPPELALLRSTSVSLCY